MNISAPIHIYPTLALSCAQTPVIPKHSEESGTSNRSVIQAIKMLPDEIIDKDYGCGDPSRYVQPGDRALDLGSGSGKICYMAAHLTGPKSSVIGTDMNDDMLALARKYQPEMTENPVYRNQFIGILPNQEKQPVAWCAPPGTLRPASENKGAPGP